MSKYYINCGEYRTKEVELTSEEAEIIRRFFNENGSADERFLFYATNENGEELPVYGGIYLHNLEAEASEKAAEEAAIKAEKAAAQKAEIMAHGAMAAAFRKAVAKNQ